MRRVGLLWLLWLYFGIIACLVHSQWWPYELWAAGITAFVGASGFVLIS